MADIQSFSAVRYDLAHVGTLRDVVAPPYDVIDAEMQSELYRRHPANVVRIILNRDEPGDEPESNYRRAGDFVRNWLREGVLIQDSQPAIYIYHQEFELGSSTITRRGFISRVRLEDFGEGRIYPHEQTHSKAKQDRLKLTRATQCNTSQIFSIFPDEDNAVQDLLEKSISDRTPCTATDDLGVVHKMWMVTDPSVIAQAASLMGGKPLFIADGHHRYETALNYRNELAEAGELSSDHPANYVSMCCVSMSDPGMIVLPTHRLWRGLSPITSSQLASRFGDAMDVMVVGQGANVTPEIWDQIEADDDQSQMAFYCADDDTWVMARLNDAGADLLKNRLSGQSDVWRSLGVSILHDLVMPELLDQKELPSPKYVRSIEEVVAGIENGDDTGRDATGQAGTGQRFEMATLVMPASIQHVQEISENRERMPAKSTYFYPKLLSGLIINPLFK